MQTMFLNFSQAIEMIYTNVPYSTDFLNPDLGKSYNLFMDLLSHKDYALFIDHDAMFTTKNWFYQISRIVDKCPDFGVMTVKTNRIGNPFQRYPGIDRNNHDIKYHREIGKKIQKERF